MSIALLRNPKARHTSTDDRESSLHVLLWVSLRHLDHDLNQEDLHLLLDAFDHYVYSPEGHRFIGGALKEVHLLRHMRREKLGLKFQNAKLAPLTRLIRELAIAFGRRNVYDEPDEDNPQLKATVGNSEWLLSKLRQAHRELKEIADTEDDWVNKVPDKTDQRLPAYLSHLVRSHFHWAVSPWATLKRTFATSSDGDDQEEQAGGIRQPDLDRQAKRIKARAQSGEEGL